MSEATVHLYDYVGHVLCRIRIGEVETWATKDPTLVTCEGCRAILAHLPKAA